MGYDPRSEGGVNHGGYHVAPQTTIKAKPRPRPAPRYSAPAPSYSPPSVSSSGQYSGGGAPRPMPSGNQQGPVGQVGNGPTRAERQAAHRQQVIAQRKERQQQMQDYRQKKQKYQNFLAGDNVYQDQLSSLQKELQDYIVGNKGSRQRVQQDFATAQDRLGTEKTRALEQMQNDFASRGLLNSSEYLDSVGKYNTDFTQRLGDLSTDEQRNIQDLLDSLGAYKRSNTNERQNARAEAIRRRAEAFNGWDPSKKPTFN